MREILIAEEHDQIYQIWVERGLKNITITHIDFHCDMRGLLIDRQRGIAYMASHYEKTFIDDGNFLAHAVMNGIVSTIRWVHDPHGGRRYDFVGCVKYESDTMAAAHRIFHQLRRGSEVSISFEELHFRDWEGIQPGEYLDIDWDGLASVEYKSSRIRVLIDDFLNREFDIIPTTTFLVYSPDYSYPDRNLFEEFANRLKEKFSARIVKLPKPEKNLNISNNNQSLPWRIFGYMRRNPPKPLLHLGYKLLHRLSVHDTRHDINHQQH